MGSRFNLDAQGATGAAVFSNAAEQLLQSPGNRLVNWDALPVGNIRYHLAGRFEIVAGTTTIRLRTGGAVEGSADGTQVLSFTTTGNLTRVERTAFMARPTGVSFIKVTALNTVNTTTLVGGVVTLEAEGGEAGILLNSLNPAGVSFNGGIEVVCAQWVVDFDQLTGSEIVVGFAGMNRVDFVGGTKRLRVRIGGAAGAIDGTEVVVINETAASFTPKAAQVTIPRPTGIQPVKLTLQTSDIYGGFTVHTRLNSIILRAA